MNEKTNLVTSKMYLAKNTPHLTLSESSKYIELWDTVVRKNKGLSAEEIEAKRDLFEQKVTEFGKKQLRNLRRHIHERKEELKVSFSTRPELIKIFTDPMKEWNMVVTKELRETMGKKILSLIVAVGGINGSIIHTGLEEQNNSAGLAFVRYSSGQHKQYHPVDDVKHTVQYYSKDLGILQAGADKGLPLLIIDEFKATGETIVKVTDFGVSLGYKKVYFIDARDLSISKLVSA